MKDTQCHVPLIQLVSRIRFILCLSFLSISHLPKSLSLSATMNNHHNYYPTKNKLLCVGICSLDTIATLDEFPTPDVKLRSTSLTHAGGGNAANTAVALSRLYNNVPHLKPLDVQIDLLSAIGDDANGDSILSELKEEHVGVEFIERYSGDSPWSYIMIVDDTRTILHQPSTRDLSLKYIQSNLMQKDERGREKLSDYTAVHFDVRHPEASVCIAEECKKLNIPYSVDVERPRDGLLSLLSGASLVICNANYVDLVLNKNIDDKREYTQEEIVGRFQKVLAEQAPFAQIGVMTLGSRGSCLILPNDDVILNSNINNDDIILEGSSYDDQGCSPNVPSVHLRHNALWCETFPNCEVVDTTGAGDAFQGGFLSAVWGFLLLSGEKNDERFNISMDKMILSHALRIASRVAARKVEKAGARDGLPRCDLFIQGEFEKMLSMIKQS